MNYLAKVSYNGKNYCGWQVQPNQITVQGTIESCLKTIFNKDIKTIASGRTDTGVSACGQVFNFECEKVSERGLMGRLNSMLPEDIRIFEIKQVAEDFNSRYSAKQKTYCYNFYLSKTPNPYLDMFATRVFYNLNLNTLKSELTSLIGTYDFTSLSAIDTQIISKTRTIFDVKIIEHLGYFSVVFTGNGFLKNMIRIIMGTAFDIARGKIELTFKQIIDKLDRKYAGKTASATGLVLLDVKY